jgi:hypothetical protein
MDKEDKNLEERIMKILPVVVGLVTSGGSYMIFKDSELMVNLVKYPELFALGTGLGNYLLVKGVYELFEESFGDI